MKKIKSLFFILFGLGVYLNAKPLITVSIPPQAYFLSQIAGTTVDIHTLIPQGADPHTFEFKPQMLIALQKSDLYLTIGLEFEEIWIPKFKTNLAHTQILSITPKQETEYCHHDHDHDHDHSTTEHKHDPHTWLSPILVKSIATNIAQILIAQYPQNASLYEKNLQSFIARIDALHQNISNKLKPLKNRTFITYHPAWGYFAKDYQLQEISIEFEGKEPTPQILKSIFNTIRSHHIQTIFVQNGFSIKTASDIAKNTGAKTWITNPLAYEWEKELLHFTEGLLQ